MTNLDSTVAVLIMNILFSIPTGLLKRQQKLSENDKGPLGEDGRRLAGHLPGARAKRPGTCEGVLGDGKAGRASRGPWARHLQTVSSV